jgi:hypothetical protein
LEIDEVEEYEDIDVWKFFLIQFLPNSDLIPIPNINRHPLAFLQQNITSPDELELNFVKTNGIKLIYSFRIQHQI